MRLIHRACLAALTMIVSMMNAQTPASDAARAVFVPIAPCRILDTADERKGDGNDAARSVDIARTRCGQIVPPYATSYSLVLTTTSEAAEKARDGSGRIVEIQRDVPAQANGRHVFSVPPRSHVAVDVRGYYVAAGTPIDPITGRAGTAARADAVPATKGSRPAQSEAQNVQGTAGSIYVDASVDPADGVLMIASPAAPWVVAKTGTANSSSGFAVANSANVELLRVRGDGAVRLSSNAQFLDGRTDFFGSATSNGNVSVPTNRVHDVTLVNPRDANGSHITRLVFFNAQTDDEQSSPPISKFRGSTLGFYGQDNVNFHSEIRYHHPTQYHYRATSAAEQKDTFWVRAGSNGDAVTLTRADMFVSGNVAIGGAYASASLAAGNSLAVEGRVGIGTAAPTHKLHVEGNIYASGSITGATVVNATYQDLAEWVPATIEMPPGTVVVLNPERVNEVMPAAAEYDARVAGVVSAQPGLLLGVEGTSKEMIATTGRVRVKVDAARAPIAIGDLLVSSGKPGVAMKSQPVDLGGVSFHRPGTIIGKALEPLPAGEGEILVLLSLQ